MPGHELAHVKAADEDALDDALEVEWIVREEIAPLVVGRITDEDIDPSGRFEGACDEFFAAIAMEDVGFDRVAGTAQLADGFGGLGKIGAAGAIVDYEVGAVLGQFQRAALADSSAGPGHQGDFAHVAHGASLLLRETSAKRVHFTVSFRVFVPICSVPLAAALGRQC